MYVCAVIFNATFTVSSSFNMDSGGKNTAEEKGNLVSLMMKRNTVSVEIEKRLKKETARDFLCAYEEMLFVNSKVSRSRNQHNYTVNFNCI